MKIDFHTHIIPGIDDGAKDIEQSRQMIESLMSQSVNKIVLTPHFYPHQISMDEFLRRRESGYEKLLSLPESEKVVFYKASETYYSHILLNYKDLTPICVGESRFLLLELPRKKRFEEKMFIDIDRMINEQGITPIIAHAERYPAIKKDINILSRLKELGCLLQMDCDSLLDFFSAGFSKKLLRRGYIDLLGTDCHDMKERPPKMNEAVKFITKKFGEDVVLCLEENAKKILCINKSSKNISV